MGCNQVCPYNTLAGCKVKERNGICPLSNSVTAKPITNADRIRAMSDEELAHELRTHGFALAACSEKAWLEWLQQPAEEVHNE